MKLENLSPAYGSTKRRKRVGRGGKYSKTAGKGEKDDTPKTGSIDVVLYASAIIATISLAGIVLVKKYTKNKEIKCFLTQSK